MDVSIYIDVNTYITKFYASVYTFIYIYSICIDK